MSGKSILAISLIAVLLIGVISFDDAFAAKEDKKDNKKDDKDIKKLEKDVKGIKKDVGVLQSQIDSFFDIFTELQESTARSDSFFDVFFDVELYSVDSFFDIFTELQSKTTDNMMGVNENTERIDSFFDVDGHVTVLKAKDDGHDADIARIDTEIVALDLRGESCVVGSVVTGIDADGNISCTPNATGPQGEKGDTGDTGANGVKGDKGDAGPSRTIYQVTAVSEFADVGERMFAQAKCDSGDYLTGGGMTGKDEVGSNHHILMTRSDILIINTGPDVGKHTWIGIAINDSFKPITIHVTAMCLDFGDPHIR